jgi:NADH dehydrogenase (ubiquinone) 1 alpha subcomplex subunit 5
MRLTSRLLSSVKAARYLEPGTPTGLTGLFTHPAPRTTLIYLYCSTLEKLQQFPESSVYRQSTESLTKHRLKIINSVVPPGYTEWWQKANEIIEKHPEAYTAIDEGITRNNDRYASEIISELALNQPVDDTIEEWDGEEVSAGELEGTRSTIERAAQAEMLKELYGNDVSAGWVEGTAEAAPNAKEIRSRIEKLAEGKKPIEWPVEPQLTADQ